MTHFVYPQTVALKNYFCLLFIKAIEAGELDERLQEIEKHLGVKWYSIKTKKKSKPLIRKDLSLVYMMTCEGFEPTTPSLSK